MPRKARQISSTGMYHVVIKGVNHEAIFEKDWQKKAIMDLLEKKFEEHEVELYCYCVMSTHLHVLLQGKMKDISKCVREMESIYAVIYNQKMKRNGHLFQGRFYSGVIENENTFWNCVNYIHNNPVKAHIVDDLAKFKYSSYDEFSKENAKRITEKSIKLMKARFGDLQEFVAFSNKNEQENWFYGTEEEITQQKYELIILELHKYIDSSKIFTIKKDILKNDCISKIAEKLFVPKTLVVKCMIDEFLN